MQEQWRVDMGGNGDRDTGSMGEGTLGVNVGEQWGTHAGARKASSTGVGVQGAEA